MAMLRISAARFGLGLAGFCLAVAQGLAQPVTSGSAETLAKAVYLYNTAGSIDLGQDYKQALKWYSKDDSLGNVDALNNLGYLHDEGLGTPRDQAKPGAAEKVTTITKLMQGGKKIISVP